MKWLKITCGVLAIISAVAGRWATWHDTEGEALVNGWPFWCALVAFGLAFTLIREEA